MRVFLDANVLFSAAYRETGSVRAFFSLTNAGGCDLVSSSYAIEEARRNVLAKHPERSGDLERLLKKVSPCREPSPATVAWAVAQGQPKDAPILAAAVEAHCHVLVTGDRTHFGALFGKRLRGTVVMLPVDAIGLLAG
jgi:Predicted nucleic acid-binding protein, contains PIN domain